MTSESIKNIVYVPVMSVIMAVLGLLTPAKALAAVAQFEIIKSSYYHPSADRSLKLSDLQSLPENQWSDAPSNFGFTHREIYVRHIIKVKNGDGKVYAAQAPHLFDIGEFWVVNHSQIIGHSLSGAAVPASDWTHSLQVSAVEFSVTGETEVLIFQRIKHSIRILSSIKITPAQAVITTENHNRIIYFMFIGAILILAAHNIAMYRATLESVFLNYLLFISVMVISLSGVWGALSPLMASTIPAYADKIRVFHAATTFVIINMLHTFLERKSLSSWVNRLADVFKAFSVLVMIGAFFDADTAMSISAKCSMAVVIIVYTMTLNAIYRGHRHAYYALLALTGPAAGFLSNHVMLRLGLEPQDKASLTLGFLFEGTVMSFGMSERIRRIKLQLIQKVQEANMALEDTVNERTARLADANLALKTEIEDRRRSQMLAEEQANIIKKQQSQLLLAARGQAVANLSFGISHEINNPLAIAQGHIFIAESIAKQQEPQNEKIIASLQSIHNAIKRITGIVRILRDFSDMIKPQVTKSLSVHEIMGIFAPAVQADNGAMIPVAIEESSVLCMAQSEPDTLKKCFDAVLSNAANAAATMPHPKITVKRRIVANTLEFLISDNGPGISPDIADHIFDPFFTTGSPVMHKGLGLTSARLLCESVGGSLRHDASATLTTFIISIPLVAETQKQNQPYEALNDQTGHPSGKRAS